MTLILFFLPLYSAGGKNTIYVISRYIFHLCLLIVPIGFSYHFYLFEENGYTVFWHALPDQWIDWLTLLVICFIFYFLARRILIRENRTGSTVSDATIIIITALPFLTGYALTKSLYYNARGWDPETGLPTRETLERLGLKKIVQGRPAPA